jgi:hypothetical protein
LVPRAFQSADALTWVKSASREELQNSVAVECAETTRCESLPDHAGETLPAVRVLREDPGHFGFKIHSPISAMLFISTLYRFDWKATLNNSEVPILRADYAFMAVPVPAGDSVLELDLTNGVRIWGIAVSFAVLFLLALVIYRQKRWQ